MFTRSCIILAGIVIIGANRAHADDVRWQRINLDKTFRSEGVTAFDVNHDGKIDVIAGDVWYEAPGWKLHEIRPVKKYNYDGGYSESFCNFGYDVNGDGWTDYICVGFPGAEFFWYENPKNAPGHWKAHLVWHSACNESPDFLDLTGDGKPELILGSQPEDQTGYLPLPAADQALSLKNWKFQPVSPPGDPKQQGLDNGSHRFYHGIGVGDFNRDGRDDVIIRHGWWEAPPDRNQSPWTFHRYTMLQTDKSKTKGTECANMYVDDLDLDGDQDIISSSAHSYGVWWWENIDGKTLRQHVVDQSFSQSHALHYVDINGDGKRDLVTGKRYWAHNGHDPGGREPVVMVWYEIVKSAGAEPQFIKHEIAEGLGTGIGTQFQITDLNGDKRPDIVLSNKKGVNLLVQQGASAP